MKILGYNGAALSEISSLIYCVPQGSISSCSLSQGGVIHPGRPVENYTVYTVHGSIEYTATNPPENLHLWTSCSSTKVESSWLICGQTNGLGHLGQSMKTAKIFFAEPQQPHLHYES